MKIKRTEDQDTSVFVELEALDLPKGSYMVMGSGILEALDIRRSHDVDLLVSEAAYAGLLASGWNQKVSSDGHEGVERGFIEAYPDWTDDDGVVKNLSEMLEQSQWVNGIPFNSLAKLSMYKVRRGQAKDFADLVLIEEYLASHEAQ